VWGDEVLKRNISYDRKKQGLIIGKGWHLIRVKQRKDFSQSRSRVLYEKLTKEINSIRDKSSQQPMSITIED